MLWPRIMCERLKQRVVRRAGIILAYWFRNVVYMVHVVISVIKLFFWGIRIGGMSFIGEDEL